MMLAMCWLQAWQQPGQGSFDMPPELQMDWTLPSVQDHHHNSAPLLPEAPAQHTSTREPQVGWLCRNFIFFSGLCLRTSLVLTELNFNIHCSRAASSRLGFGATSQRLDISAGLAIPSTCCGHPIACLLWARTPTA